MRRLVLQPYLSPQILCSTEVSRLKQSLLQHLGVKPGQKIEIDTLPGGKIMVRSAEQKGSMQNFIGCLSSKDTPALTIDEIETISTQGWAATL